MEVEKTPVDTLDSGEPVGKEHVLKERTEVRRSKSKKPKPNTKRKNLQNMVGDGG
jgi:hypothetical protein